MAGLMEKFKENYDPQMVGIGLLSSVGKPTSESLGQALLMGRQARLQQATDSAAAAAAARKEQQEAGKWQSETTLKALKEGYAQPTFSPENPYQLQGGLQRDPNFKPPSGDFGSNPTAVYNPKLGRFATIRANKSGEQFLQDFAGKKLEDDGNWVVVSQDPAMQSLLSQYKKIGGVRGETQGEAEKALPGAQAKAQEARDVIKQIFDEFPVMDKKTGRYVDSMSTAFDPETMQVREKNPLATGPIAGLIPNVSEGSVRLQALLENLNNKEFIGNLVASKAEGATFGALSKDEKEGIENERTIATNPRIDPVTRVKALQNLLGQIDRAAERIKNQAQGQQGGKPPAAAGADYFSTMSDEDLMRLIQGN